MESIEAVRDAATRVMAGAVGEVRLGTATSLTGSDRSTVLRFMVDGRTGWRAILDRRQAGHRPGFRRG